MPREASFSHLELCREQSHNGLGSMTDSNGPQQQSQQSQQSQSSQSSQAKIEKRAYRTAKRVQAEMLKHSQVVDPKKVEENVRLECDEVLLGDLLGSGKFCHVIQVHRIDCKHTSESPSMMQRRSVMSNSSHDDSFAIKFLRNDLTPDKYCLGAAELVVEMNLLSSLKHPHVINLHAVSREGPLGFQNGNGYFFILDRLFDTLDQRLSVWRELEERQVPNEAVKNSLFLQRLQVAADVSSALAYLHSHKILYRGIDPTNLGFNGEGKIVLFDLGLARELEEAKLTADGVNYELSGNKGSLQYMAPEVGMCQPYGLGADVYGMSILLWQVCTLSSSPFPHLEKRDQYLERVVQNRERPKVDPTWSETLTYLMRSGWTDDSLGRPPMKQFHRNLMHELHDVQQTIECLEQSMAQYTEPQITPSNPNEKLRDTARINPLFLALSTPSSPAPNTSPSKSTGRTPKSPSRTSSKQLHRELSGRRHELNDMARRSPSQEAPPRRPEHQQLALEALEQVEQILEAPQTSRRRSVQNRRPEHKLLAQEAAKEAPTKSVRRRVLENQRPEHKLLAMEAAKHAPARVVENPRPEHKLLAMEAVKHAPVRVVENPRPEHKLLAMEAAKHAPAKRRLAGNPRPEHKLLAMEAAIQLMGTCKPTRSSSVGSTSTDESNPAAEGKGQARRSQFSGTLNETQTITIQGQRQQRRDDSPPTKQNKKSQFLRPKRRDMEVIAQVAANKALLRQSLLNSAEKGKARTPSSMKRVNLDKKRRSSSRNRLPPKLPQALQSALLAHQPKREKSSKSVVWRDQADDKEHTDANFAPHGFPTGLMPAPTTQRRGSAAA